MKRFFKSIAVLVLIQAALVRFYFYVEDARGRKASIEFEHQHRPAPDLSYRTFTGATQRLSDLRGRPVLLHFWATWCPPCRDGLPGVLDFADRGPVHVVAVSVDPDWRSVWQFIGRDPPPIVVLVEDKSAFGIESLPETYLIDAQGMIRLRMKGAQDWTSRAMQNLIETELQSDD